MGVGDVFHSIQSRDFLLQDAFVCLRDIFGTNLESRMDATSTRVVVLALRTTCCFSRTPALFLLFCGAAVVVVVALLLLLLFGGSVCVCVCARESSHSAFNLQQAQQKMEEEPQKQRKLLSVWETFCILFAPPHSATTNCQQPSFFSQSCHPAGSKLRKLR